MAVSRRAARPRFTLLLLVLTAVTFVTLDRRGDTEGLIEAAKDGVREVFAPVNNAAGDLFSPVGDFFSGVTNYGDLKAENRRLREQLQEAEGARIRAADAERERKALLDLQELEFAGDIPSVTARVVSASGSNFELTIQLDKGTDAGVIEDMPVVAGAGLVGRVSEASPSRSTVILVADPTFDVGVRLDPSGDVGVASGTGRGKSLLVDLVEPATRLKSGDPVVTSGLQQSAFPPGIPIGRIDDAGAPTRDRLQRRVTVDPAVDLSRLHVVKVLLWEPGS